MYNNVIAYILQQIIINTDTYYTRVVLLHVEYLSREDSSVIETYTPKNRVNCIIGTSP